MGRCRHVIEGVGCKLKAIEKNDYCPNCTGAYCHYHCPDHTTKSGEKMFKSSKRKVIRKEKLPKKKAKVVEHDEPPKPVEIPEPDIPQEKMFVKEMLTFVSVSTQAFSALKKQIEQRPIMMHVETQTEPQRSELNKIIGDDAEISDGSIMERGFVSHRPLLH